MLKKQGVIETWHDRRIGAGQEAGRLRGADEAQANQLFLAITPDFAVGLLNVCRSINA